MLLEINKNRQAFCKKCLIVFFQIIFMLSLNCMGNNINNNLRQRAELFYKNWGNSNFEECWKFLLPDIAGDKKDFIEERKKYSFKLIGFKIISTEINGDKAKTKMEITISEEGAKITETQFDYWTLKNNIWYLTDFGRTD